MPPEPRVVHLPERAVVVLRHRGPADTVDETRRPAYRHMIIHELVGGPSILRWLDPPQEDRVVDALVQTHLGFGGDDVCPVEHLAGGPYAVVPYEGPPTALAPARNALLDWCRRQGHRPAGPVLQVHLMDPLEGELEAELQVPIVPAR